MRVSSSCAFSGIVAFITTGAASAQTMAEVRAAVVQKRIEAPMRTGRMSLTDALRAGGGAMRSDFVTFGIEVADGDFPAQPVVTATPPKSGTIGEFLDETFRQVPNYDYEVVSGHTVSVYPRGAKDAPDDILNFKVSRFDVDRVRAGAILSFPDRFIPELQARLFPPAPGKPQLFVYSAPGPPGPEVTLHLRNVTVREILNAVSIATEAAEGDDNYPCGWVFRTRTESGERKPYWGVILSLPANWKELASKRPRVVQH